MDLDIYSIDNRPYVSELINFKNHIEIIKSIQHHLRSNNIEDYQSTCCFIRDIVLLPEHNDKWNQFTKMLYDSKLIAKLERDILSMNYLKRSAAIYTLAKICSIRSVNVMKNALDRIAPIDPINASHLMSEIWWLEEGEKDWKVFDKLCDVGLYSRWGALNALNHWSGPRKFESLKMKHLRRFSQDTSHLIRIEAMYIIDEIKWFKEDKPVPEEILNPRRFPWEPSITFDMIKTAINNWMYTEKKVNYSIKDIDRFISSNLITVNDKGKTNKVLLWERRI